MKKLVLVSCLALSLFFSSAVYADEAVSSTVPKSVKNYQNYKEFIDENLWDVYANSQSSEQLLKEYLAEVKFRELVNFINSPNTKSAYIDAINNFKKSIEPNIQEAKDAYKILEKIPEDKKHYYKIVYEGESIDMLEDVYKTDCLGAIDTYEIMLKECNNWINTINVYGYYPIYDGYIDSISELLVSMEGNLELAAEQNALFLGDVLELLEK